MDSAAITRSLELVAERGDPTALVYARVFAAHPGMEALFVRDTDGGVRGNMLAEVVTAVLDFIERDTYGGNLMRIEIVNHENLGVPKEVFGTFFTAMRDAFAEGLGAAWTADIDAAWKALLAQIESISVAQWMCEYRNPGKLIADALGCPSARSVLSDLGENLPRGHAVEKTVAGAAPRDLADLSHAHHEEFVEVRADDRRESQALEGRHGRVGRLGQDAVVEGKPG
mgnify:CR=1 FL=1